jgi:hypothetical protein
MENDSYGFGSGDRPATRTGPPWEQDGALVNRYIETAKGALLDPQTFFSNMRRQGGLGAPLTYGMLGSAVGLVIGFLIQMMLPFGGAFGPMPRDLGETTAAAGGLVVGLVLIPVCVLLGLFIGSGIIHLILMLLGGARFGYETTFRVIAYTNGSTGPLAIVPFCGGLVGAVWGMILAIIGISRAHETTVGKAAAAVLLPIVLCCLVFVVFFAFFAAMMAGLANRANV